MKIKTISRSIESASRGSKLETHKMHKNADPKLHPFERAREYTRAVTAVKLDRMMSKPFIGALSEHSDGIFCSATSPTSLVAYVSGAADGEVIVWDLPGQSKLWSVYAHTGFVRGLTVSNDGDYFFSCGDDKTVKQWRMAAHESLAAKREAAREEEGGGAGGALSLSGGGMLSGLKRRRPAGGAAAGGAGKGGFDGEEDEDAIAVTPVRTWAGKHTFMYIDHNWKTAHFATSSTKVDVWDYNRSEPIHSYEWGADTISTVRFNPAEHELLASTGNDRSVVLYDIRTDSAVRKILMRMNCNSMAWNPREPFNFTLASEDSNCYTFDMRKMDTALMVHKDHVGAVMDVHYSPTGREFVTGSYDRTVRIWKVGEGKSRECYYGQRMQRVFTTRFSADAKYVISGSDDTNVRIWKAEANAALGRQLPRERAALDYADALKKKFAAMPEVKKIASSRNLPKNIIKGKHRRVAEEQKMRKKLENVRAHSKPNSGAGVPEAEKKKSIVAEFR